MSLKRVAQNVLKTEFICLLFVNLSVDLLFVSSSIKGVLTDLPLVPHICVSESGQRLFGAKPLSKPMSGYCQLDPKEQISVNF